MDKIVFIASDLSGKPVAAGIAKSFDSGDRVKLKCLSDDVITDYSNDDTELVLKDINGRILDIFTEYGDKVDYFLVCGGACLNVALVTQWCFQNGIKLSYLVWEKKLGRYVAVDGKGRLVRTDGGNHSGLNYTIGEETTY